jgi:hypothetical protein
MTLQEVIRLVLGSEVRDWHVLEVHSDKEDDHVYRAVFKPNPSISLCWGAGHHDFEEEWTKKFIGREAATERAEVFFNGSIVFRETYVEVDAGKGILPMPRISDQTVPEARLRFAGLLHDLSGKGGDEWRFGQYVQQAGLKQTGEPWPEV